MYNYFTSTLGPRTLVNYLAFQSVERKCFNFALIKEFFLHPCPLATTTLLLWMVITTDRNRNINSLLMKMSGGDAIYHRRFWYEEGFFSVLNLSPVSRKPAWKGKRLLFIDTWEAFFAIDWGLCSDLVNIPLIFKIAPFLIRPCRVSAWETLLTFSPPDEASFLEIGGSACICLQQAPSPFMRWTLRRQLCSASTFRFSPQWGEFNPSWLWELLQKHTHLPKAEERI